LQFELDLGNFAIFLFMIIERQVWIY